MHLTCCWNFTCFQLASIGTLEPQVPVPNHRHINLPSSLPNPRRSDVLNLPLCLQLWRLAACRSSWAVAPWMDDILWGKIGQQNMLHDLTWVVSGCFCMFLPVFVKLIFFNIVFVCFCGAYFLMVSFNAYLFASPPSSISDFTCWFKRERGTNHLFVYTKIHCSVYLCVEARIHWTLNRFASVQFQKLMQVSKC